MITEDEILKVETRSEEFARLVRESQSEDGQARAGASVRIADFALANAEFIRDAMLEYVRDDGALAAHLAAGAEPVARPVLSVFDWSYNDPETGKEAYARTPERAGRLAREGVKLTPVYTIDASAPPAKAEVKVKALEWSTWPADGTTSTVAGYPLRYRRLRALTKIGAYFVNEGLGVGDEPHFYVDLSRDHIWDGDTIDEAKAAAQADYDQRIRSALAEDAGAAVVDRPCEATSVVSHETASVSDKAASAPSFDPLFGSEFDRLWAANAFKLFDEPATPAPASDDLVERGRKTSAVVDSYDSKNCLVRDLVDRITSDAATIASLRAECGAAWDKCEERRLQTIAAEAERDALKAEVEQVRGAFMAAIEFTMLTDESIAFLKCWNEGDWPQIAQDWPKFDLSTTGQWPRAALAPIPAKEG
jgi:hypothetical protein